jgi:hypothetical protein
MAHTSKNLIVVLVGIVIVGSLVYYLSHRTAPVNEGDQIVEENIEGCYVARLGQDVYTLRINSLTNGLVNGMLSYKNFQKDSSSGPLVGTYTAGNGILLGDYSFDSEGMHSVRQVIFKKMGNTFVQGFGPVNVQNDREYLTDINTVTFDPKSTFIEEACIQ